MAVSAAYVSKVTVTETLDDTYLDSADKGVKHSGLDTTATYTSVTGVPVTKVASFQKTMSGGAGTIDLRALVGTNGGAVDGNGLKVQLVKFRNKATNANDISITFGASNPYPLFGSDFKITLKPGQEFESMLNEQAADISGSAKTLDIAGTGSQILECIIVMG